MTAEQLVRDILEAAIKEGLITCVQDPQTFTAGSLCTLANLVAAFTNLHKVPAPSPHSPNA